MPRIPSPINWLRQRNDPNDLLMTASEFRGRDVENREYLEEIQYSQIMSSDGVKKFLFDMVNTWLDSLELTTINVKVKESDAVYGGEGVPIWEEQERLVPQWDNGRIVIVFRGLDQNNTDDDNEFMLGMLSPNADLEEVRNDILEIIEEYWTPPLQVSQITIYTNSEAKRSRSFLFRPLNPIDLDEFFGLE